MDIVEKLDRDETVSHFNIFGVVVDVSQTKRSSPSSQFKTVLRVIDPSFHYKKSLQSQRVKHGKFAQINFYTETYQAAPFEAAIGDILRLKRFTFRTTDSG